jgi:V-type H+-transporting ATPase subunit a
MTFALCLQLPNHIHFKRPIDIWANFVPQMIFFQSIFGYLVVCIIYKWCVDWTKSATEPPSLLNMLISMFLEPGVVSEKAPLYRGQSFVQVVLLLAAAVCVPWLLITKPYVVWKEMQRTHAHGYVAMGHEATGVALDAEEEGNGTAMTEEIEEPVSPRSHLIGVKFSSPSRGTESSGTPRFRRGSHTPSHSHH